MTDSHTFLVFDVLESFEEYSLSVLENISQLGLSFFSWSEEGRGGRPQKQTIILIIPYQRYILSTWFIPTNISLDHLDNVEVVRFLQGKVTLFPRVSTLCSLEGSCYVYPAFKEFYSRSFPCGPVVKNLPANTGMCVWSLTGELRSHMQPSLCTAATDPDVSRAHALQQEKPPK